MGMMMSDVDCWKDDGVDDGDDRDSFNWTDEDLVGWCQRGDEKFGLCWEDARVWNKWKNKNKEIGTQLTQVYL